MKTAAVLVSVYIVVAFLTYGYILNRWVCTGESPCRMEKDAVSAFGGALWPAYWAAKGALEVTKP